MARQATRVNIRKANFEDAPSLVAFNQAMALETEGKSLVDEKIASGVAAVFDDEKKGFYVVCEDGGRIVAGLMVTYEWSDWRNAWFWWIQSVYVLPDQRGRKLYSRMYDLVKQMAAESGNVCGFRLYVETENVTAQKVYDAVGMHRSHYLMFEEEV